MFLIQKPENIIPLLIGILSCYLLYASSLSSVQLIAIDQHFILSQLKLDDIIIKNYVDIFNRLILCLTIIYFLYLYYTHLKSITLIISIFLMLQTVFYMALLANIIPLAHIDYFLLNFFALMLWHNYFFSKHRLPHIITSCLLFAAIAFINPTYGFYTMIGIVASNIIYNTFETSRKITYSTTFTLIMCGFCSFTVSVLMSQNIHNFLSLLKSYAILSLATILGLSCLVLSKYIAQKPFLAFSGQDLKTTALPYGFIVFFGSIFIGRFDYIAHFA
ncbi:MAG: hypothetical protein ACJARD_000769 [Alphaproteobacteria bacterium]|jgi:hypothetical protein